ncbi:MAG: phosphopantetheine-binding protein [Polyangiaceae bacterium]|jgi:acyl carrier protein|nr:phosphopantetheine-binding protein [Polyangiaceae bacterium]
MTRAELVAIIRLVLSEKMALPNLQSFSEDALLNEQLCLDSVLMLELLVHLELDHGLALPEEAALQKQAGTVGSLAEFLLAQRAVSAAAQGGAT